ncbi:hypothetical protein CC86DRAFT_342904 [Ophiobolus disseminans]|uniref:Heterokaryon incompatibility domain-containing protein n=1 Tax=Ophiobolus disseminans TaxID=1469910 RepID=A0A6A7AAU4_9PLEO|nr:hypothetical protein CC86DRAFT_342904 [Ophiobolus disseminans]
MAIYNLWQSMTPQDPAFLQEAIDKMNERVSLSRALQERAKAEDPGSRYLGLGQTWESVGLSRLAVLYVAAGDTGKAVAAARECRRRQTNKDPTVSAFSAFFLGNALWHDGQKDAALQAWNVPPETTSPPTALCKEPSEEHNGYLKFMADAGVDFDISDEHGFSALDYAILGDSKDAVATVPIVEGALKRAIDSRIRSEKRGLSEDEIQKQVNEAIAYKKRQAELRRLYRTVLQEQIRPELRAKSDSTLKRLRAICSRFVTEDLKGQTMLDKFKYVRYIDFKNHQKLPRSDSGLVKVYSEADNDNHATDELFVIFFSYRWIGGDVPDDSKNTQWKRMISCAEAFLVQNPDVRLETLGIWLDLACIDQDNDETRRSGIDALPLAVTQCNAMISLVDPTYYTRAWCVVEVMLIRELQRAYKFHVWQEESDGSLQKADKNRVVDLNNLGLSREDDRPSVDFLLRQSALLGKDDA